MRLGTQDEKNTGASLQDEPVIMHYSEAASFLKGMDVNYTDYNTMGEEWVTIDNLNDGSAKIESAHVKGNVIPNVIGMNVSDAVYLLEGLGISTHFSGQGVVSEQSLHPGDSIKTGSVIYLKLSQQ